MDRYRQGHSPLYDDSLCKVELVFREAEDLMPPCMTLAETAFGLCLPGRHIRSCFLIADQGIWVRLRP